MNKLLFLNGVLIVLLLIGFALRGSAQGPPTIISGVQTQQQGGLATVIINGSKPFEYRFFSSKEGETPYKIQVEIANAVLQEPVIRDMANGPVRRVNGVQWSSQPPVVRFSIEGDGKLTYEASASGSMLGIAVQAGEGPVGPPSAPAPERGTTREEMVMEPPSMQEPVLRPIQQRPVTVIRAESTMPRLRKPSSLHEKMQLMQYREASIISVLRAFAEQYNLNIVIAKDVEDDVITVRLQDVTLKGALDAILTANGYNYIKRENILLIKSRENQLPGDVITEIFTLQYINANDIIANLQTIKSTNGIIQKFQQGPIGTVGVSLPVTGQMGGLLEGGGGGGGEAGGASGGPVAETERANILIITETPENMKRIRKIIKELDRPRPQVRIDVKLVETKLTDKDDWGVNWTTPLEAVGRGGQPTGITMGGGAGGAAGGGAGQTFVEGIPLYLSKYKFGTLSFAQFRVVLEFLESRGDTKLLNQPSITVIDNQQADIAVGSIIPIEITQLIQQQGGGGGGGGMGGMGGAAQTIVQQQPVTISLTVIPRVNEDKYVTLWVQPQVNEISGYTGKNADLPITSLRSANTQVRVRDGDTIVIGGLIKEDKIRVQRRVKFIWRIPLIGRLFKHTSIDTQRSELIIFITPYIIRNMDFLSEGSYKLKRGE